MNVVGKRASCPKTSEAVIIQDDNKNRGTWKLGIVADLIVGKDGVARGTKVRTTSGMLERAVQHIYPPELSREEKWRPTPCAPTFTPQPTRDTGMAAKLCIQELSAIERDE